MKITVFGASGHVGKLVVERLLSDGHEVTAFVHGSNPFESGSRLTVVRGDIHSSSDVKTALAGTEAIISCLGSWHTPTKDILASAMRLIIPIAEKNGVKRIISLTGAAANAPGDSLRLIDKVNHFLLGMVAPKILHDGEEHIRLLSESSLNWTVIRSPIMTKQKNVRYRLGTAAPSPLAMIPRAAIVAAIVDLLGEPHYDRSAPYIFHSR